MDKSKAEIQKEYDSYFELFNTNGWVQLTKELSSQLESIDVVSDCKDIDDLRIRQGQIYILKQLINLEQFTEISYKNWLDQTE